MDTIDVSNRGKRWSETDSERLKTLYGKGRRPAARRAERSLEEARIWLNLPGKLNVPCSIWSRLVQYNIIAEPEQARGYDG